MHVSRFKACTPRSSSARSEFFLACSVAFICNTMVGTAGTAFAGAFMISPLLQPTCRSSTGLGLTTTAQEWSADGYQRNAAFVSDLGAPLLELLAPESGERIMDLGCGEGALTEAIAAHGASVLGVDSSFELLEAASLREGVDIALVDGQSLPFRDDFDAVFSNAALHWMPDGNAVVGGVARSLKEGGRFVGEFGGHGNVASIVTALLAGRQLTGLDLRSNPWFFPTPEQYGAMLESKGFSVEDIALIPRPTALPTGIRGWIDTFADPFFDDATVEQKQSGIEHAVQLLEPSLCDTSGAWTADYVRLRFSAVLNSKK